MSELSVADIELGSSRKPSRISVRLPKLNTTINWDKVYDLEKEMDYTNEPVVGSPARDIPSKKKRVFLQHLHNLSDSELEDQVNDRLSFSEICRDRLFNKCSYTTLWLFIKPCLGAVGTLIFSLFFCKYVTSANIWAWKRN